MKKSTTPTFLLELPLAVTPGQAKRLQAHFEAARCLYNALLGEALHRLKRWQPVLTMRSTGSVSVKQKRYAFGARGAAWTASRASVTIRDCVSFRNLQKRVTRDGSYGARFAFLRSLTGMTLW